MASSKFIVSAIKYRPNIFGEVLAQEHITRTLQHSLKRGHIANAYLFSGPRGTGKTTTARILAKAMNCENSQDGEPCNQCEHCRMISHGNHPDVLEIDAASNTGVDNIRQLRENARFTPSMAKFKIFIIDECHMLSTQANNALLKTLEEPPDHCRFIFATTELQKILPTILSRCQRYPFRRIPAQVIVEHLRDILSKQTEIPIADPSQLDRILFLLARSSEGCLRDALFSLDQLLAFCSGQLELSEVEEIMGAIEFDALDRYVRALLQEDLPTILQIVERLSNHGKEMSLFLSECLQFLRNLAVTKISPNNMDMLDLPDDYRNQLSETASMASLEHILYITDQLWDAEYRIRNSSMGRIILEMASIKAAKAGQAVKIDDLLKKISSGDLGSATVTIQESRPAPAPAPLAQTATAVTAPKPVAKTAPKPAPAAEPEPPLESYEEAPPETAEETPAPQPAQESIVKPSGSLSTIWNHFLKELEEESPMLAGALEHSVALDIAGDFLQIAIPSENMYSLRTLERPANKEALESLIQKSFGKKLTLRCEASDELNEINQKHAQGAAPQQPAVSRGELMEKVQKNQIFSKLMDELPGRIVDIKPSGS